MLRSYLSKNLRCVTQFSFALCILSCQGPERHLFVQLGGPAAQQQWCLTKTTMISQKHYILPFINFTSPQGEWWLMAQVVLGKQCGCLVHWRASWDSCPVWHGQESSGGIWQIHQTAALLGSNCAAGSHHPWGCREQTSPNPSRPWTLGEEKCVMNQKIWTFLIHLNSYYNANYLLASLPVCWRGSWVVYQWQTASPPRLV